MSYQYILNALWVMYVIGSNKVASAACSISIDFKVFICHLLKLINTGFCMVDCVVSRDARRNVYLRVLKSNEMSLNTGQHLSYLNFRWTGDDLILIVFNNCRTFDSHQTWRPVY